MKRLAVLALPLLAACGGNSLPDIPTFGVGGGGVTTMTNAKTPFEHFEYSYADLTKQHYLIKRNIQADGNRHGAEAAAEKFVRDLEIMKSVLVKPEPAKLDPYIEYFKEIHKLIQQNRIGGAATTGIDQKFREIKNQFPPDEVEVVGDKGETAKTAKKEDKLPPPVEKKDPAKKEDDLPPPVEKKDPPPVKKDETPVEPDPAPKTDDVAYRLMYKAWQKSHEDLVAAFKAKKEAKERYEEVLEALRGLRKSLDAKQSERLQIYLNFYEKIKEDTKVFTAVPDGLKEEDVLNDFKIVSAGIAKDFDPSRRK